MDYNSLWSDVLRNKNILRNSIICLGPSTTRQKNDDHVHLVEYTYYEIKRSSDALLRLHTLDHFYGSSQKNWILYTAALWTSWFVVLMNQFLYLYE